MACISPVVSFAGFTSLSALALQRGTGMYRHITKPHFTVTGDADDEVTKISLLPQLHFSSPIRNTLPPYLR